MKIENPSVFSWDGKGHDARDRREIFVTWQEGKKMPNSVVLGKLEVAATPILQQMHCLRDGGVALVTNETSGYVIDVAVPLEANCNLCPFGVPDSPCTGRIETSAGGQSRAHMSLPEIDSQQNDLGREMRPEQPSKGAPIEGKGKSRNTRAARSKPPPNDRRKREEDDAADQSPDHVSGIPSQGTAEQVAVIEPTLAERALALVQAMQNHTIPGAMGVAFQGPQERLSCAIAPLQHSTFGMPTNKIEGGCIIASNAAGTFFVGTPLNEGGLDMVIEKGGNGKQRFFGERACNFCPAKSGSFAVDGQVYICTGATDDPNKINQMRATITPKSV